MAELVVRQAGVRRKSGQRRDAEKLIGVALAVFLGFRNSTSYDRYWEGRKLWGSILAESRTLTRQIMTLPQAMDATEQRQLVLTLVAIAYSLRHQLRQTDALADLQRLLPADVYAMTRDARFAAYSASGVNVDAPDYIKVWISQRSFQALG